MDEVFEACARDYPYHEASNESAPLEQDRPTAATSSGAATKGRVMRKNLRVVSSQILERLRCPQILWRISQPNQMNAAATKVFD